MRREPWLGQNAIKRLNTETVRRYARRLEERGPGAYALGWGKARYQTLRFQAAARALEPGDLLGRSVLDVGCGLGDLYEFLAAAKLKPARYLGLDINASLLQMAAAKLPQCRFEGRDLLLNPFAAPVADTGLMLGVINFKLKRHQEYARELIRRAFSAVRSTLLVNAISDVHNEDYPREPFIHYHKPAELLAFAQTLTPFCSLIQDYRARPQYEFMLILRKKPWSAQEAKHGRR